MRAIHVDKCQAARGSLHSRRERVDIQIASPNRLSLFSYFVPPDVTEQSQQYATQMKVGNDQNL